MTRSGTQVRNSTRDAIDAPCDLGYVEGMDNMKTRAATKATDFNTFQENDFKTKSFIMRFCKPSFEDLNTLSHTEWIMELV